MPSADHALSHLPSTPRMPAVFLGHGSPMHAIQDSAVSRAWRTLGRSLPRPQAILCVSAHWMTRGGTLVHVGEQPETIHDFAGFPPELFAQRYPAPGAPEAARAAIALLGSPPLGPDTAWGLDHGAWSVLLHLYPEADVPVFQLSLDLGLPPAGHLELARGLRPLRERGILILGSGNLVHNLRALAPGAPPYDWAAAFDDHCAEAIAVRDLESLANPEAFGRAARLSHPTWEHYLPALYPLAVADADDELRFFNEGFDMGSISMRSFVLA